MSARPVQQSLVDPTLERPVGKIPMSVVHGTNADLIASIAPLYLTGSVLDVTYGRGKWWDRYRPDDFTFSDLETGVDFRALPHDDGSFDAVCFDPPYVPAGGKRLTGQTRDEMNFRSSYGLDVPRGHEALLDLIVAGLAECSRVKRRWLLVKCSDYVDGGIFRLNHFNVVQAAHVLGLRVHDFIVHAAGTGPGGHNIYTPVRARRAHSYLIVFRKHGAP